jgi:hypothetical protein
MKRFAVVFLLAALLAPMLVPGPALAQMYRWTDERGQVHYSQGLESVPSRYRASAVPIGNVTPPPPPPAAPSPGPAAAAPGKTGAPTGGARIEFRPGQQIIVSARINDSASARLILDTGADTTMINPLVLAAAGVSYRTAVRGRGKGIGGTIDTLAVRVDSIEVAGAKAGPLLVTSHDADLGGSDGLLGRDFLDHFIVTIDNQAGVLTLAPKK